MLQSSNSLPHCMFLPLPHFPPHPLPPSSSPSFPSPPLPPYPSSPILPSPPSPPSPPPPPGLTRVFYGCPNDCFGGCVLTARIATPTNSHATLPSSPSYALPSPATPSPSCPAPSLPHTPLPQAVSTPVPWVLRRLESLHHSCAMLVLRLTIHCQYFSSLPSSPPNLPPLSSLTFSLPTLLPSVLPSPPLPSPPLSSPAPLLPSPLLPSSPPSSPSTSSPGAQGVELLCEGGILASEAVELFRRFYEQGNRNGLLSLLHSSPPRTHH
ncbi:unnamed protein product [Closterium sp. Naga37s-1]|nr:unnamed protein product [Closterium sp. Naga37s-1]